MAIILATAPQDAACNAIVDRVDIGTLNTEGAVRLYDSPRPADADTAITTQTLLAEIPLATTAYGAAVSGVATLAGTPLSDVGLATGTASWCRVVDKDENAVFDGTVGTSGADFVVNSVNVVTDANVTISAGSFTMPNGT